ncbi:VanZ like family protein [Paraliobacillus sp. PM-2]|uniref:VanZ family protein n=1 Tax=Paraliobacillus sp. PM-2 TaxID=1462524 RepID=UPI00061C91B7|nr:VanZ family protein [Paraliobacillus sp. PM-2]CQR48310.1 VanZ like family protein [Paraliobacillus sp. PM-2]
MISLDPIIIYSMLTLIWIWYRGNRYLSHKGRFRFLREIVINLFFVYLLAVTYVTMEPFYFTNALTKENTISFDTNLFYNLLHMADGYLMFQLLYSLGNVVLFVPLGIFVPYLFKHTRHFFVILLLGFFSSLTIELIQTSFTLTRLATVDDLFFNTFGAVLGYLVFTTIRFSYYSNSSLKNNC